MKNKDEKYTEEDLILGYFAGELTEEQARELLEWLNKDPSNRETLSKTADWWATAHIPLFIANMQADFNHYFGKLAQRKHPERKSRAFNPVFFRNIAAAVLALLIAGSTFYYIGRQESRKRIAECQSSPQISSEISTPLGSISKVVLPDGSLAWVNSGSTLKYTIDNGRTTTRQVSLSGEAYFEVVPDSLRPFIVKSGSVDIKVSGTSFNVKAYPEDPEVDVALITGSVNVSVHASGFKMKDIRLSPNRMLSFYKETNDLEMSEIKGKDVMAWVSGRLVFCGQPFPLIARELERKFNVNIRIESKRLEKEMFTGSFSSAHTLNQILREIDVEKHFTWKRHENELIIRDGKN